jgi:hypothetical protein
VTCDVFEEDPFEAGSEFTDEAGDIGPEVALVSLSPPLTRLAERLTRIASQQGVKGSGERSGVEGGEVVPDGSRGEVSGALCRKDGVARIFLPLDKGTGVKSGLGKTEAHIEATSSCAEGDTVPGAMNHVTTKPPLERRSARRQSPSA